MPYMSQIEKRALERIVIGNKAESFLKRKKPQTRGISKKLL